MVKIPPLALELDLDGVILAFGVAGNEERVPGADVLPIMFM